MNKSNPWTALALLLLVCCFTAAAAASAFRLEKWEQVVKTEAGEVRVLRGSGSPSKRQGAGAGSDRTNSIHIGFIFMEPKSLFIPQYLDSSLVLFVHRGNSDDLVEKQLKMGDILHIPAGSTFYMVNTSKGQRLQVICSVDASESLGFPPYQSFFVGGGRNPVSVLAGFHKSTLSTAFNVPEEEIETILGSQTGGPIVMVTDDVAAGKDRRRGKGDRGRKGLLLDFDSEEEEEEEEQRWSWRELLENFMIGVGGGGSGDDRRNAKKGPVKSPHPYNLYDRDPDVKNKYGWSLAVDEHDYKPLKHSDIGVYIVNLTAVRIDAGAAREPKGGGVRRGARRLGEDRSGVPQRHGGGECEGGGGGRLLDPALLPVLPDRVAERPDGVLRVHDVVAPEPAAVPGGGALGADGDGGAGARCGVRGAGGDSERGGKGAERGRHHARPAVAGANKERKGERRKDGAAREVVVSVVAPVVGRVVLLNNVLGLLIK
ncbi:hypothetical protein ZIOFF_016650 [Zingiber officinale]|uniref:Cupin type-1 domain-containing protein n=1 Tax=Zingiber officinale TaxID=94328 RepID=A0A8J5LVI1_ZINOF|nr:hypothetical protein ZIOFF_016650 [Zingiber officinale]